MGDQGHCRVLPVPQRKAYHLIRQQIIPTHKVGPKTRIGHKPEIDRALASLTEAE